MTKRIISLLLVTVMLLSMTSCSKKEQTLDVENMTLEEYIETVELPENLTISIDPATVEERETAMVYTNPEYIDFDDEELKKLLLHNPVTEENIWAEGPQYVSKTDTQIEYLTVYDGGEACFGEKGKGSDGGFSYHISPGESSGESSLEGSVVNATWETYVHVYNNDGALIPANFRGLFQSIDKTLDFASREEIAESASVFLQDVGVPEFEIHEILAYDIEALKAITEYDPSKLDLKSKIQKSDEHYNILCRQLIDGIPINTYSMTATATSNWRGNAIALKCTKDGWIRASMSGLIQQPTDGIQEELLSAAETLELVKEYYGQGILLNPHTVESMELVYIAYSQERESTNLAELRPYWLIKTSYQQDYPAELYTDFYGNPLEGEIKAYDYTYFDAVTGEYFVGSTSGKPVR